MERCPTFKWKSRLVARWVYKVKKNADRIDNWYKAHLVAKGYAQTHGIDYEETFALVAKVKTICTVIALARTKGWHPYQMDVKNVFLQGEALDAPKACRDSLSCDWFCILCIKTISWKSVSTRTRVKTNSALRISCGTVVSLQICFESMMTNGLSNWVHM